MPIEGPLKELSIQDVLQLLELAGKTGALTVRSERLNDEAIVHFDRGVAVFASRRRSIRLLGQQLLRAGKVTERELARALDIQRTRPGHRLGGILVEQGSVMEEELVRHLRFQIEETIFDLMNWDEGYFHFVETEEVARAAPRVEVRIESLLMEGARRIDEWARLESRVPHPECVPTLLPVDGASVTPLNLRPDEWEVLGEIDGERDLRRIAADVGKSSFDVAKIVYGLASMDIVQVDDRPAYVPEQELDTRLVELDEQLAAAPDEVEREVAELEQAYPQRAELPLLAGRALAAQGRMRAAAEAFERAVGLDPLSADAHYHLGLAAVRVGELDRAERAWQDFLRLASDTQPVGAVRQALDAIRTLNNAMDRIPTSG
ncbi:MAG: DUF4388 domain-containing protein [Gemmatimonadota bacterium]